MGEINVKKKGLSFFKIIVIAFLIIITGLICAIGYFTVINKNGLASAASQSTTAKAAVAEAEAYVDTEEFVVNLADEGMRRYLKTKMEFAYPKKNKKLALELEEKKNIIRDVIISIVTTKKADDLTEKGKEDMKAELLKGINGILKQGQITEVYYTDIFIQ
jgi:flagellar FliL protein